jgi:hypothetical protein
MKPVRHRVAQADLPHRDGVGAITAPPLFHPAATGAWPWSIACCTGRTRMHVKDRLQEFSQCGGGGNKIGWPRDR